MSEHALKTWPEYWTAIESGAKTFEVRRDDDRNFQPGDILSLREWDPSTGKFTGRDVKRWVTYVLRDAEKFGVHDGFVVLGLTPVPPVFAPPGHRYINGEGRCECGEPGNPLRRWIDHVKDVGGASADYAATAGAQVAHEQATEHADTSVTQIRVIPPEEWCQATRPTDAHEGPHSCDLRQGHDDTVHKCPCGTDWVPSASREGVTR